MSRFRILPTRSRVWIEARSNVHPIHTEATGLEGWLDLEIDDGQINVDQTLLGHLEFPVTNLKSGNGFEDKEMQRRIEARRHPTIHGDLKVMKETNEPLTYVVGGDLTFRGVTRSYEDEMIVQLAGDNTLNLSGLAVFDIRDFGMEPPRILMLKVQPEVTVRVEIIAEKES
ncbi:MAG: YceI family protein [Ilumatobacteraceae bacterium]